MEMSEWILSCIGVPNQGVYLDKIVEKFGVDLDYDYDTVELVRQGMEIDEKHPHVGDMIARELFDMTIDRAINELGLDEDKFDYTCSGTLVELYYDGEDVDSWEALEEIANNQ